MRKGIVITLISCLAILCLLGAAFRGFLFGHSSAKRAYERERKKEQELFAFLNERAMAARGYNDAGPTLFTLEDLRAMNTNSAIVRLESKLDTDLFEMWNFYKQHPEARPDAHELERLSKVREYRLRYSRDTPSSIDVYIAEILSWTNSLANK